MKSSCCSGIRDAIPQASSGAPSVAKIFPPTRKSAWPIWLPSSAPWKARAIRRKSSGVGIAHLTWPAPTSRSSAVTDTPPTDSVNKKKSGFPRLSLRSTALLAGAGLMVTPVVDLRAQCLPGMCGFAEAGKAGRFVKYHVDPIELARADKAIADGSSSEGLLAAQSVNRGQLYGAGLSMRLTEAKLSEMLNRIAGEWKYRPVGPIRVRNSRFEWLCSAKLRRQRHRGTLRRVEPGRNRRAGRVVARARIQPSRARPFRARGAREETFAQLWTGRGRDGRRRLLAQHRLDARGGELGSSQADDKAMNALADMIWAQNRELEGVFALRGAFFSRVDEDRADVAGLDLAVDAGYSPNGALNALN